MVASHRQQQQCSAALFHRSQRQRVNARLRHKLCTHTTTTMYVHCLIRSHANHSP
ncbi:hypothetical protein Tcan_12072 [Toxocara canis]|uniref:Uncharacterized protein n=1 Tax=Toxocara canis TaxID=6265 RepID=A0A0B2UP95_TOXCA|nr:hypothetical protein Tcan_12072 [Toxocara canis]